MESLRVLIANFTLEGRTGTETYLRDLALGLLQRGHRPCAYTPRPGDLAKELQRAGVPVVSDLRQLDQAPQLIQGHHHPQLTAVMARFPGVPAVYVCHDRLAWHSQPPLLPGIRRYVAVDENCRERLVEAQVPEAQIRVVLNSVDLSRFHPREALPPRPRRGLIFSNEATEATHLPAIREACRREGLELEVVGAGVGRLSAQPEEVLGRYDLVFAKARCALEALAVGTAVVLVDTRGVGPLVTLAELPRLRRLNLGMKTLTQPIQPEVLQREIARYDAADATRVSQRIRETASLDFMVQSLLDVYAEVLADPAIPPQADQQALAAYLRGLGRLGRAYWRFQQSRVFHGLRLYRLWSSPTTGPWLQWLWRRLIPRFR